MSATTPLYGHRSTCARLIEPRSALRLCPDRFQPRIYGARFMNKVWRAGDRLLSGRATDALRGRATRDSSGP